MAGTTCPPISQRVCGLDETSTASAKPKHLRVIYANNLTVETRQYASTVMLHDNLYLPREYSCTTALLLLALSLEWLISRLSEAI